MARLAPKNSVNFWSCTKTLTALAALVLVDRGELDPFAPVASYWPEFAANGKQDIEIRHLLFHTSGVSGWEAPFGVEDVYDWDRATSQLAAQAPWWEPGTASGYHGYHALTYGHLIGEVVRRITGRSLKDFVRDDIAEPLGADVQIGADTAAGRHVAELVPPPPRDLGLARLGPTIRRSRRLPRSRQAPVASLWPRPHRGVPAIPDGRVCWWGGWGGSIAVMDTDRRATYAYVMKDGARHDGQRPHQPLCPVDQRRRRVGLSPVSATDPRADSW